MIDSKITFVASGIYTLVVKHSEAGTLYSASISSATDTIIKIPGVVKFTPTNVVDQTFSLNYTGSIITITNGVAPTTYLAVATQSNIPIPSTINLLNSHPLLKNPS
jgi:hypothetical protein